MTFLEQEYYRLQDYYLRYQALIACNVQMWEGYDKSLEVYEHLKHERDKLRSKLNHSYDFYYNIANKIAKDVDNV